MTKISVDKISVDETDLLAFFGVEPVMLDKEGVPWIYNRLTYEVTYELKKGEEFLVFELSPSYREVQVSLRYSGRLLFEFQGSVLDVKCIGEHLEIFVSEKLSLQISLKPFATVNLKTRPF